VESCVRIRGRLDSTSVLISRTDRLGRLPCTRCALLEQFQRREKQKPKPREEGPPHQTRLRHSPTASPNVFAGICCGGRNPTTGPKRPIVGKGKRQRQKAKTDRSQSNHPPRDGTFGMLCIGRLVVVPTGGCGERKNHHHQTDRSRAKTDRAKTGRAKTGRANARTIVRAPARLRRRLRRGRPERDAAPSPAPQSRYSRRLRRRSQPTCIPPPPPPTKTGRPHRATTRRP
jgi:hypothetical protein